MRYRIAWNEDWLFTKHPDTPKEDWEAVTLPHTWNAQDGQDGGGETSAL